MQHIKFDSSNQSSSFYIAYIDTQHGLKFVDWLRSLKIPAVKVNTTAYFIVYKFCDQFIAPRQDFSSYFKSTFNNIVGIKNY